MLGAHNKMVFREEMQKAILTSLALKGCFNDIVFQGGTALRLFYGNPRFSEDIDLVLHQPKKLSERNDGVRNTDLASILHGTKQNIRDTFPFINEVDIRTQKNDPGLQRYILKTHWDNPEHSLRIHIELAAIPSYRNSPRILNFPPVSPAVRVEYTDEILANKICALALRPYLKGRDLWDIYYLIHDLSVKSDWGLVRKKVSDYSKQNYGFEELLVDGLGRAGEKIRLNGESTLRNEMERFMPNHVIELYRSSLDSILRTVIEVISELGSEVQG